MLSVLPNDTRLGGRTSTGSHSSWARRCLRLWRACFHNKHEMSRTQSRRTCTDALRSVYVEPGSRLRNHSSNASPASPTFSVRPTSDVYGCTVIRTTLIHRSIQSCIVKQICQMGTCQSNCCEGKDDFISSLVLPTNQHAWYLKADQTTDLLRAGYDTWHISFISSQLVAEHDKKQSKEYTLWKNMNIQLRHIKEIQVGIKHTKRYWQIYQIQSFKLHQVARSHIWLIKI